MRPQRPVSPAWLIPCLLVCGCLERKEEITVTAEGAVLIAHRIRGDGADLDGGQARYPTAAPWKATRSTEVKPDGKVEHVLLAAARFEPGAPLPADFARDEAERATALQMPTAVQQRREAGRTITTFARTYAGRRWAPYQVLWDRAFTPEVQALFKEAEDLPGMAPDRRRVLLGALLRYEQGKVARWADDALLGLPGEGASVEGRLEVRAAIERYAAEALKVEEVERLLLEAPERIEARAQEVVGELERTVVDAATRALRLSPAQSDALRRSLRHQRRAFEVSEDLGDEAFVVRLRLPGKLLAHNGDAVEDGAVVWRFAGRELRDRDHTLLAVSAQEEGD